MAGKAEKQVKTDGPDKAGKAGAATASSAAKPAKASKQAKAAKSAKPHVPVKVHAAVKQAGGLSGTRQGVVESDSRNLTRRVVINYLSRHPKYGKFIRNRTILQVHDAKNEARAGDIVEIAPCRPISRTKRWVLVRVVENRAAQAQAIKSVAALSS